MRYFFSCSRDDLVIRGECYCGEGDHLPIIIISHGFMADMGSCRKYARHMEALGYAAFIFDFNGGGIRCKSSGSTDHMSVLTEVQDLKAVIRYAKEQSFTDAGRIVLMGCSQGGFVSALTAASSDTEISSMVLFYPALCIPDDARSGHMMFARFDPDDIPETFHCGPMRLGRIYPADVMHMDPMKEISAYQGPVLIIHGTGDRIVPVRYAEQAAEAYAYASLVKIKDAPHGFWGANDRTALSALDQFLEKASAGL